MNIRNARAIGIVGLAQSAAAATSPPFDLVCRIATSTVSADIKPIERTDDARFSIDLGRKLWCRHKDGACAKVLPIAETSGDALMLSNTSGPQGDNRIEVDVKSGAYRALIRVKPGVMPAIVSTANGRCTMAPATPGLL